MLVKGTSILTEMGYRAIEQLEKGERVSSGFGRTTTLEIIAVMSRAIPVFSDTNLRHSSTDLTPVVVPTDANGPGRPRRDVYLSPQQQVLGLFKQSHGPKEIRCAAAGDLFNMRSPRTEDFQWVEYFALFFETESFFIAEGILVAGYTRKDLFDEPSVCEISQLFRERI